MFDPDIIGKKVLAKKKIKTFGYSGLMEREIEEEGTILGFSEKGTTHQRIGLFSSESINTGFSFAVKSISGEVFETSSLKFIEDGQ